MSDVRTQAPCKRATARRAALSESRWQRSTDAKALRRRRQMSGIATGQVAHRQPSGGGSSICATRRCKRIPGGSLLICLLKNSEKKKSNLSDAVLCWHYLAFRVGQVLSCRPQVSSGHLQAEKSPGLSTEALCWHYLSSRAVARQVLSAYMCLTSVFGMGTGGPT